MGCYVTGDIHGNPYQRFNTMNFYEQKEFNKNKDENIVFQLGDFGIVWNGDRETKDESYKLDWLAQKNFTLAFVDGNHDNIPRLDSYPVKEWNGGLVNEIRPNVFRLKRGEVFEIEDKKFFAFGGASSHDISDGILDIDDPNWKDKARYLNKNGKFMYRTRGLDWWSQELPSEEEMQNGINNLDKHAWKVDYILTHSPHASGIALIGKGYYDQDVLTRYLEDIRCKVDYDRWFAGHMHENRAINAKDILLYEQIVRIV